MGLCRCHSTVKLSRRGENKNSVQTDFANLDQNFWESDARRFIVSTFKQNRVWGKGFQEIIISIPGTQ